MHLRGRLFTLITACMFGLGAVLAKLVGENFNAFFAAWMALAGGGIFVACFQFCRRKALFPTMTPVVWRNMLLFSSLGTALPLVCIIVGLAQTSAITGSFLLQLQGPAAIIFAVVFLREKMGWKQAFGILLLLAGSILVILRDFHSPTWTASSLGDLFILIGALGIGFSYVPGKRLTEYGDALQIVVLRLLIGSCCLLPFLAFQANFLLTPLTWPVVGVLALYTITNFGVGYLLQQAGLGLIKAWESAAIMQTLPLFSTTFAVLILHDTLTVLQIIGGGVILLGGLLTL